MEKHRIDIRMVGDRGDPRLPGGWEMYVDGYYAGRGPESSRAIMEEMAVLHTLIAATPDEPHV